MDLMGEKSSFNLSNKDQVVILVCILALWGASYFVARYFFGVGVSPTNNWILVFSGGGGVILGLKVLKYLKSKKGK